MQKQRVFINAVMSVAQVIVVAGFLFILYRFLINVIGVEKLGIWSVVLATTSVANVANLGLSASVVKFVAKYLAKGEEETAAGVIQTSAISLGILIGLAILIFYPFANWFLGLVIPATNLQESLSLLPYGLLSLWMIVVSTIFQAGLEGHQRFDLRSIVFMASALIHLIICFVLVPRYGLMGLAYSYVIQSSIVFIGSWLMLKRQIPILPLVPYQWDQKVFREMISYGLNMQIISISLLLYDPVTKALLTKFGGLATTGYYEMANQMVMKLRSLIISANQVLVPAIADMCEKSKETIQKVYKESYRLVFYVALLIFATVIAFAPIISKLWIGHYEEIFVIFATLLAIGWFLNTLAAPAYFVNLGIGELRWNTLGHVIISVFNLGLGLVLGRIYGGTGVVISWAFSLVLGSFIIPISYHYRHKIPIIELLPKESIGIGFGSLAGISLSLLLFYKINNKLSLLALVVTVVLVFFAIVAKPFWQHTMRKRLMEGITYLLSKRHKENRQI